MKPPLFFYPLFLLGYALFLIVWWWVSVALTHPWPASALGLGYGVLFAFPCALIGGWFIGRAAQSKRQNRLYWTALVIAVFGGIAAWLGATLT